MKSRVLLVDDSPSALFGLRQLLDAEPHLLVVGEARTRAEALALAEELRPDLVTMDVYLGGHDGVEVARSLLRAVSTRVVMVTGLDKERAEIAFRALAVGALDVLGKPSFAKDSTSDRGRRRFVSAIGALSRVKIVTRRPLDQRTAIDLDEVLPKKAAALLALGASTGGPPVLQRILARLPQPFPVPIVIVQHIEPSHVQPFAEWLAQSGHPTKVVHGATHPAPGHVYLAPGNFHLRLSRGGLLQLSPGEPRQFQIPSIDVLFESIAEHDVAQTFAALLTGMGSDGAEGLVRLAELGAMTAVQSLDSCVVPGMPSSALRLDPKVPQLLPEQLADAASRFFAHMPSAKENSAL